MTGASAASGASGVSSQFRQRVLTVIGHLRPGEVASYGDVAAEAGYPGAARAVGAVLANSGDGEAMPWWRVVTASGRLVPGHETLHARLLRREGVTVTKGQVARIARPARARRERST